MKHPAPSRKAHDDFCRTEGWKPVRNAKSKKVGHHVTYELTLDDGRVLRTRISQPPNKDTYGPGIWSHILRDQLQVDEATFWACANDGIKPDRGRRSRAQEETLPVELAHLLASRLGLNDDEIRSMTKEEAIERISTYWAGQ